MRTPGVFRCSSPPVTTPRCPYFAIFQSFIFAVAQRTQKGFPDSQEAFFPLFFEAAPPAARTLFMCTRLLPAAMSSCLQHSITRLPWSYLLCVFFSHFFVTKAFLLFGNDHTHSRLMANQTAARLLMSGEHLESTDPAQAGSGANCSGF